MESPDSPSPSKPGGGLLSTRMQYFEQELMRSITNLVKNVHEYFQLANGTTSNNSSASAIPNSSFLWQTVTVTRPPSNVTDNEQESTDQGQGFGLGLGSLLGTNLSWDDVLAQLLLLVGLAFVLWLLNRRFLHWTALATVTEVLLSWAVTFVVSPLALLLLGPIFIARACVNACLHVTGRARGSRVVLASPFESVWSFEAPNSPSSCVSLLLIEGECNLERIRSTVLRRLVLRQVDGIYVNDCFRRKLRTVAGFVAWERVQHFDIMNHVRTASDPDRVRTEHDVFQELAALHEASLCDLHAQLGLPEPIPPWEFLVFPKILLDDGRRVCYGMATRVHHSMMDGISMGNLLRDCLADRPFKFSVDPCAPLRISLFTRSLAHVLSIISLPRITFGNLFFFESNAFHGRTLTGPKHYAWSRPLRMDTLKQLKTITHTSVFAVLLSSIGGSLQRLYAKRVPGKVPKLVHACPPVALLPYPDRYPRNRFSIVLYPVLLGGAKTALHRLTQVFRDSKSLSTSPDVLSNYYVVYMLGLLPAPILNVLAPLAHATFTFSNIPGPAEPVEIFGGHRLLDIGAWLPIKNRIGIGTALFSYQDRLRVSFIADKAALAEPDDVTLLRDGFEDEISDLTLSLQLKCDKLFMDE